MGVSLGNFGTILTSSKNVHKTNSNENSNKKVDEKTSNLPNNEAAINTATLKENQGKKFDSNNFGKS